MRKDCSYGVVVVRKVAWSVDDLTLEDGKYWKKFELLLVQHKNGWHWWLPKWHPQWDESHEQTALREVFEETGVKVECVIPGISFVEQYRFIALWENKEVDKTVVYFLAIIDQEDQTLFDLDDCDEDVDVAYEEIVSVAWVIIDEAIDLVMYHENARIIGEVREFLDARY